MPNVHTRLTQEYEATPHSKANGKNEYQNAYQDTPQYKAYKKEYDAKRRATPQYKAYQEKCQKEYRQQRIVKVTPQSKQEASARSAEWYARNVERKRAYNAEYRKRRRVEAT